MLNWGEAPVSQMIIGEMGIKTAAVGGESIYVRPGGYFYLELSTEEER